jgi:hypothetical protein
MVEGKTRNKYLLIEVHLARRSKIKKVRGIGRANKAKWIFANFAAKCLIFDFKFFIL